MKYYKVTNIPINNCDALRLLYKVDWEAKKVTCLNYGPNQNYKQTMEFKDPNEWQKYLNHHDWVLIEITENEMFLEML